MFDFTEYQLELLQRARDDLPLWGGSVATPRLPREVELLFAVHLLKPGDATPYRLTAAGTVEVAFSLNEGSEHLVIKVIDSAKTELKLLSYRFTSAPVVEALVRARHRGVKVTLVADYKDNVSADQSGKARAALGALVNAGADVHTISFYAIHHDKVIIADRQTVEQGSFNYSDAAAHRTVRTCW